MEGIFRTVLFNYQRVFCASKWIGLDPKSSLKLTKIIENTELKKKKKLTLTVHGHIIGREGLLSEGYLRGLMFEGYYRNFTVYVYHSESKIKGINFPILRKFQTAHR